MTTNIRSYTFSPIALRKKRQQLEMAYQNSDGALLKSLSISELPLLLEKIRALPTDYQTLEPFAQSLSSLEIRLLASMFPYADEQDTTIQNITNIIITRYTREIGRMSWRAFQQHCNHPSLIQLLKHAFEHETKSFLGLDSLARTQLQAAFQTKEPLVPLAYFLTHSNQKAQTTLRRWMIQDSSALQHRLIYQMLSQSIHQNTILDREDESTIVDYLETFSPTEYQECIEKYLVQRDITTFHRPLLQQAAEKLGDPRSDEKPWEFLLPDKVLEIKKYLNRIQMMDFFGEDHNSERFCYWENHVQDIKKLIVYENYHKKPLVLIMYFDQFVVVEFSNTGHAAHFYHKNGFEQIIVPKIRSSRGHKIKTTNLFLLKDKRPVAKRKQLYINSLAHMSSWQERCMEYMSHYQQENWTFTHTNENG
ncbi:EH signature domain-containing protein [Risungbinella massiliensis]|uniref:EH signature domain-containing protein n=1 Tax=Risungbinella massiliensis TaxID=1329796 RepID=UPI0005CC4ACC|nr:EH signature domain-containing protein [Risungbinella massiliensis]